MRGTLSNLVVQDVVTGYSVKIIEIICISVIIFVNYPNRSGSESFQ